MSGITYNSAKHDRLIVSRIQELEKQEAEIHKILEDTQPTEELNTELQNLNTQKENLNSQFQNFWFPPAFAEGVVLGTGIYMLTQAPKKLSKEDNELTK